MRTFAPHCPKCQSLRVHLTRTTHSRWIGMSVTQSVLHCVTCGKEVFGDAATEEVARQLGEWTRAQGPRVIRTTVPALSAGAIRAVLAPDSQTP